ncbi:hypothetical protein EFW17_03485 [Halostreptopolyspora alba]|uniref:Uncharacterized protein n=1 Tax=Halostreptopolyspora alba TaxID=2487137 RepID=A0A3N0EGD8_9ACTN|nr:hypothetical protein EFW17_03485 [Nocardiopsaceae bacterium YIM 96095]
MCIRDTLLHLPDLNAGDLLLTRVASSLVVGGRLVLTYRDLTQQLAGTDQFLPVRNDDERIMLCALDCGGPETVTVNDLVYTHTTAGRTSRTALYKTYELRNSVVRPATAAVTRSVACHDVGGSRDRRVSLDRCARQQEGQVRSGHADDR